MRVNSPAPSVTVQRPQVERSNSAAPGGAGTGPLPGVQVGENLPGYVQDRFLDGFETRGRFPAPVGPGGLPGPGDVKVERDNGEGSGDSSDSNGSGGGEHNPPDIYNIPGGGSGGFPGLPGTSGSGSLLPVNPGQGTGGPIAV